MSKYLINDYPVVLDLVRNMPQNIVDECSVCTFERMSVVLMQDYPIDSVYLVCSGKFIVEYMSDEGYIYDFEEISSRDFIGEMEVITGEPYSLYTVKTIEQSEVVVIPRASFIRWLNCDINITNFTLRKIANKWKNTAYKASTYKYSNARYKVATFILNNAAPDTRSEKRHIVPSTRQGIADKTGLSVRTVNRALKVLQHEGFVEIYKGKIFIREDKYDALLQKMESLREQVRT